VHDSEDDISAAAMQQLLPFAKADGVHDGTRVELHLTRSGDYAMNVQILAAYDLMATYYCDSAMSTPLFAGPIVTIDFSRALERPADEDTLCVPSSERALSADLPYNSSLSVRWSGFIRPHVAQIVYTANLSVTGADERMKLWVSIFLSCSLFFLF